MPQKTEQNLEEGQLQENDNARAGSDVTENQIEPMNKEKMRKKKD